MGIRSKLLLPLLLLVALFAGVFELVFVPTDIEAHYHERGALHEQRLRLLAMTLQDALLKGNLAQIHMTLNQALEQQPEWRVLTLVSADGRRIYPIGAPPKADPGPFLAELSREIRFLDEPLGTLYLTADMAETIVEQRRHLRNLSWGLMALLLAATSISAFTQDRLVRRPLDQLARAARRIAQGDFQVQLPKSSDDEVGQLVRAFAAMSERRMHAETALQDLAYTDPLTGLPNRARFNDYLADRVALSAKNLYDPSLPALVERVLEDTGMEAHLLHLEITENAVMQNAEQTISILEQLRSLGVGLAIDDFGTGYSSLNYLKRFPIDTLKVDRSFVRDIPGDADDTAITYATITMAHSLKCRVVAEGAETAEQRDLLRSWSCEVAQGYLYSKPLPAQDFLAFANAGKRQVA